MSGVGCMRLPRDWQDDPIFGNPKREPFDRRSAWLWLVEHASWRDSGDLQTGQLRASLQHLACQWGWNTTKVARFIRALQERHRIVTASDTATVTLGTLITICNYGEFLLGSKPTVTPTVTPSVGPPSRERYPSVTVREGSKEEGTRKVPSLRAINGGKEERTESSTQNRRVAPHAAPGEEDFVEWYQEFPRHEARGEAKKAYDRARRKTDHATLMRGARRYAADRAKQIDAGESEPKFTKHPATWLNKECWADETLPLAKPPKSWKERQDDEAEDHLYRGLL